MVNRIRYLLLAMAFTTLALFGCGDGSETEAPSQPPGLRKKIALPQEPTQPASSDKASLQGQGPEKAAGTGPRGQASLQVAEAPEPLDPEKRGLVDPDKSDSLKLAEGMTTKPAFFYDPRGKQDPFESPFETETERVGVAPAKKIVKKKRLPLTPLQRISLSQLKLVAIVLSPTGNKALVEEPSGKGYIISQGTYIGENFGRVTQILKDRVIVEGEMEDVFSGKPKTQTTELTLHKKVGDG